MQAFYPQNEFIVLENWKQEHDFTTNYQKNVEIFPDN